MLFNKKIFELGSLYVSCTTSHWLVTHFVSHLDLKVLIDIMYIPQIQPSSDDKFAQVFTNLHSNVQIHCNETW